MSDNLSHERSHSSLGGAVATANDNDLAQELIRNNHDALGVLIDRYQRLVFTIAFRIVRDVGEAEDLVQVVFLEIFRKAKLFDPAKGTFKVWLLRYAYTRSMNRRDQLEHRRFYTMLELDEIGPLPVRKRNQFDSSLTEQEAARFVEQALGTLNDHQRSAVHLIALEGLTLEEAAKTLGYSLAATRNYYYRGILALRAFGTGRLWSAPVEAKQGLAVGNEERGVAHLKARPA
jgi:RNA polymerase sigma-70 factor (ECF subfamily)